MICRFSFSSAECCELQYKEMWWFVFPLPVKIQDVINDKKQATSKLYYPQPVKFICTNFVSAHTTTKQIAVFYWIVFYSVKTATFWKTLNPNNSRIMQKILYCNCFEIFFLQSSKPIEANGKSLRNLRCVDIKNYRCHCCQKLCLQ